MNNWIELSIPYLFGGEKKYLIDCIESNYVSSIGPLIEKFEDQISKNIGLESGHTTATSSGTTALHLALLVSGVKEGDLVIMPDYTFIATANAISHSGGIPWLVDIEKDSLTINIVSLRDKLEKETKIVKKQCYHIETGKKVAAIVPVYTLGHPPDLDKLKIISEEFYLPIISDAAAGIGSRYKNSNIGNKSLLTCFSFNGNKSITCGGGGALSSTNKDLVSEAKHLASTARNGPGYTHDRVGYNYRMTNIQAAIGLGQIENLKEIIEKKREISNFYSKSFKNIANINPIPERDWALSSKWLSGFILNESSNIKPSFILNKLNNKKIRVREFWKPIHLQKPYLNSIFENLEYSSKVWERIIILPSSTNISKTQLNYVTDSLKEIFN